jgi:exopolyphosphatase/guanosine-5'-triphosphate,3'-diphosphate pyrophosphatase
MKALLIETRALRARYDEEPSHSDQVARLALELFDALGPWHQLGDRDRALLHCAALLHDIGWSQVPDGRGHHKWSARLIQEHGWKALKKEEVALVAQVARYHRKSLPKPEHEAFHALPTAGQKLVMILGGVLRVADALDRTHTARVKGVTATVGREALSVQVEAAGNWDEERDMFELKRDMLELAAGRTVRLDDGVTSSASEK